ncbi:unnamed protein product [Clavelina lepadiformis]|uniref:Hexosyltransferase n=1 Tax=Clavelina lepadiformis TaxID=159417 RepID=A0ABP0FK98_CLALP
MLSRRRLRLTNIRFFLLGSISLVFGIITGGYYKSCLGKFKQAKALRLSLNSIDNDSTIFQKLLKPHFEISRQLEIVKDVVKDEKEKKLQTGWYEGLPPTLAAQETGIKHDFSSSLNQRPFQRKITEVNTTLHRSLKPSRVSFTNLTTTAIDGESRTRNRHVLYTPPVSRWIRTFENANSKAEPPGGVIKCTLPVNNSSSYSSEDSENSVQVLPAKFQKYLSVPKPQANCGFGGFLQPWNHFSNHTVDMIFLVKSAPKNFQRRQVIRKTWGFIKSIQGMTFATIFLVGTTNSNQTQSYLEEENQIFGDLLQCNVQDTYRALPLKVLAAFGWFLRTNLKTRFLTVTDDDCVMNILNINAWFQRIRVEAYDLYCGFLYNKQSKPNRHTKNKWYVSPQQYSGKFYPSFCHGGMWTLRPPLLQDLYCMSEVTEKGDFHLEDVYITGILREKLGHTRIKPVLMKNGRKFPLMYYPWDENDNVHLKMLLKWRSWNFSLPWKSTEKGTGLPMMTTYEQINDPSTRQQLIKLKSNWVNLTFQEKT